MKKYFIGFLALFLLTSCGNTTTKKLDQPENNNVAVEETQKQIIVTTSIIPLSSVVNTVGGKFIEVENIVPAGVSPHGFDLSAKQMARISESEKVFMIGLEHIDGFLEKAVVEEKQVHLADGMELIEVKGHDHSEHEEEEHHDEHENEHDDDNHSDEKHDDEHHDEHEEEGHDEHNHSADPHVWLGKNNIIEISERVRDELSKILPEQAEYFANNTNTFIADLEKIYSVFETQTAGKVPKEFIVFHDAYNYLMQSANIDMNLKIPFSENVLHEIGTAHMTELIEEIKLHSIQHAFTEPQFSAGNLQKFANEYNLVIGTLDPLGTDASAKGYLENIKSNLTNLAKVYE